MCRIMRTPVALLLPPRDRRGSATGVATNLRGTVLSEVIGSLSAEESDHMEEEIRRQRQIDDELWMR